MPVDKTRQPGSSQREEFLIVLEYLLNFTYDKDHASSQAKIIQYAKEKYGLTIRRTRIGEILIHLEQLCADYPKAFPFKLETVETNVQKKYYISQWQFSDEAIVSIARSILNDKLKPMDVAESEIQRLLNNTVGAERRAALEESIRKYDKKVKRLSSKTYDFYKSILTTRRYKYRIWFTLKEDNDVHSNLGPKVYKAGGDYAGYIYDLVEIDDRDYVIIYIDRNKSVLVTPFKNIEITDGPLDVEEWKDDIYFDLNDPKYSTIHQWFNDYFKGQTGVVLNITIKVDHDNKILFQHVKKSIEDYWFPINNYEVKTEEVMVDTRGKLSNITSEKKVVNYAYINIKSNESSFKNWYMNMNMYQDVIIVDPPELNNKYFEQLICKLKDRVDNYGS